MQQSCNGRNWRNGQERELTGALQFLAVVLGMDGFVHPWDGSVGMRSHCGTGAIANVGSLERPSAPYMAFHFKKISLFDYSNLFNGTRKDVSFFLEFRACLHYQLVRSISMNYFLGDGLIEMSSERS